MKPTVTDFDFLFLESLPCFRVSIYISSRSQHQLVTPYYLYRSLPQSILKPFRFLSSGHSVYGIPFQHPHTYLATLKSALPSLLGFHLWWPYSSRVHPCWLDTPWASPLVTPTSRVSPLVARFYLGFTSGGPYFTGFTSGGSTLLGLHL
jgi:hypothetical protein